MRKLCRSNNSNVGKCLAHQALQNFQNSNIIKAALKLKVSTTTAAICYFSLIKRNVWVLLVIFLSTAQPAILQL